MDDIKRIRKIEQPSERREKDSAFEALYNKKGVEEVEGAALQSTNWGLRWGIGAIIGLLVVGGIVVGMDKGWIGVDGQNKQSGQNVNGNEEDVSSFYVVRLAGEKVYYGRLSKIDSDFPELRDVFYPLNGQTDEEVGPIKLVKREVEPDRPDGVMNINKQNLILFEKLSVESPIVKAIRGYLGQ